MKTIALCAAFALMGGAAHAGPCSDRLAEIERKLAATDAGSGPTQSAPAPTTAPESDVPRAGEAPGTGGTAGMNATVGDKAASPGDVRAQTSGQPTAAQGGATTAKQLSDTLAQAKSADAAGNSAQCEKSLDEAEALLRG